MARETVAAAFDRPANANELNREETCCGNRILIHAFGPKQLTHQMLSAGNKNFDIVQIATLLRYNPEIIIGLQIHPKLCRRTKGL